MQGESATVLWKKKKRYGGAYKEVKGNNSSDPKKEQIFLSKLNYAEC